MDGCRSDPRPRGAQTGPGGERARAATARDADELVSLALEACDEAGATASRELVEWAVQAALHDPLRGLFVLAEAPGAPGDGDPATAVGMAALAAVAELQHGWSARLSLLYVRPSRRHRGVGRWLLAETLELARHHGMNHVVCAPTECGEGAHRILTTAGFSARQVTSYEIDLPPLYDDR